ncbi:hypothetical protein [Desulfonema magnum]|uniref:Uncharacterized protein n=1 Tax=Desulfonema magnum TaxID=45655 RepID=A0A975BP42_9BACT|nr:hypothetical protein [Desulfonema magnum]QTA89086.1 Uncharacterized protein dnm_051340 [Desulfonema magnum]
MSKLFKSGGSGYKILRIHQEKTESLVNQGLYSYGKLKKKKRKNIKENINITRLNKKREKEAINLTKRLYLQVYTSRFIIKEIEARDYSKDGILRHSRKSVMSVLWDLFRKYGSPIII